MTLNLQCNPIKQGTIGKGEAVSKKSVVGNVSSHSLFKTTLKHDGMVELILCPLNYKLCSTNLNYLL